MALVPKIRVQGESVTGRRVTGTAAGARQRQMTGLSRVLTKRKPGGGGTESRRGRGNLDYVMTSTVQGGTAAAAHATTTTTMSPKRSGRLSAACYGAASAAGAPATYSTARSSHSAFT